MVNLVDAINVWCANLAPPVVPTISDYGTADGGGGAVITYWNATKLGAQPTTGQLAAITQSQVDAYYTSLYRAAADSLLSDPEAEHKLARAVLLAAIDQLNTLREWTVSFKAATAAATSLSNLQTRVAALPTLNDITAAAAKTAVKAKIDDGSAD